MGGPEDFWAFDYPLSAVIGWIANKWLVPFDFISSLLTNKRKKVEEASQHQEDNDQHCQSDHPGLDPQPTSLFAFFLSQFPLSIQMNLQPTTEQSMYFLYCSIII